MGIADTVETENVVGSASFGRELSLEALSEEIPTSQYNPENFPGLVCRTQEPKAATMVFRSGEVVSTGADTIGGAQRAVAMLATELRDLGIDVSPEPDVRIENIVSSADLGEQLNLGATSIGLGLETVEYEPEQFPGLVYRIDDIDAVAMLFSSGKVVITGVREVDRAPIAVDHVQSRLDEMGLTTE